MNNAIATKSSSSSKYIVVERNAKMPSSCGYAYMYCAVIETDGRDSVSMISERSRGVRNIVRVWAPYPKAGNTMRSGRKQALTAANALAAELNARETTQNNELARELHRAEGC